MREAAPRDCCLVTLAIHPDVEVQRCQDCGCVSIHFTPKTLRGEGEPPPPRAASDVVSIDAVSLRLDDAELETLWAAIGAACTTLHELKSGCMERWTS